jgi:FixJ family two-component response regulator
MNPKNLNLYIVDDDEAVRRSLGNSLLAHMDDCSIKTFPSGEAFLRDANIDASGVVVLDYLMEGMTGLEVHQVLLDRKSPLMVIFLSGKGDIPVAVRSMEKGAVSWLQKPLDSDVFLATVMRAKEKAADIAMNRRDRYDARIRWSKLTLREMQISALVAPGKSAKEIAQKLTSMQSEIDHRTVENHRSKVFQKLDVKNSNELLIFLQQNDLWDEAQASLAQSASKFKD